MSRDLKDMVAIAAGSRETVAQWAYSLRRAAITFHIATTSRGGTKPRDAELWVAEIDAEEAKYAIRSAEVPGIVRLW